MKSESTLYTDPKERANILNSQFKSAFSGSDGISDTEFKQQCKMEGSNPPIEPLNITLKGIDKLLKNLNPFKAAGPDNIKPKVLKELLANKGNTEEKAEDMLIAFELLN